MIAETEIRCLIDKDRQKDGQIYAQGKLNGQADRKVDEVRKCYIVIIHILVMPIFDCNRL